MATTDFMIHATTRLPYEEEDTSPLRHAHARKCREMNALIEKHTGITPSTLWDSMLRYHDDAGAEMVVYWTNDCDVAMKIRAILGQHLGTFHGPLDREGR